MRFSHRLVNVTVRDVLIDVLQHDIDHSMGKISQSFPKSAGKPRLVIARFSNSLEGSIIIIVSFATDSGLVVVIAVNSSVRRVITNDHRLAECSFL